MKKIVRAEHSGFCFGVKQAIEKTEQQLALKKSKPIYTWGPLIHNQTVTDDLSRRGAKIIESLEEVLPGDTVIVRSHGESEGFFQEAAERGITIVDATCPFVAKIQRLVKQAFADGHNVIIIGDREHPEVRGISGWCNDEAYVINSIEDAEQFEGRQNLFVVCQTTSKG